MPFNAGEKRGKRGERESTLLTPCFPLAKAELLVFVTPIPLILYMCVCVYIIYRETHTQIYISKIHYLLFPPTPLQEVEIIIIIVQLKTWKNKTQKENWGDRAPPIRKGPQMGTGPTHRAGSREKQRAPSGFMSIQGVLFTASCPPAPGSVGWSDAAPVLLPADLFWGLGRSRGFLPSSLSFVARSSFFICHPHLCSRLVLGPLSNSV